MYYPPTGDCYAKLVEINDQLISMNSLLVDISEVQHTAYLWIVLFVSVFFSMIIIYIFVKPLLYFFN